jgi:hypothetical protein
VAGQRRFWARHRKSTLIAVDAVVDGIGKWFR